MDRKTLAFGILIGVVLGIVFSLILVSVLFVEAMNSLPVDQVNVTIDMNETEIIEYINQSQASSIQEQENQREAPNFPKITADTKPE